MARKNINITLDKGRDKGKRFLITEMPAMKAERWATQVILGAMGSDGFDMSKFGSMQNIAQIGVSVLAKLPFEVAEPLMAEMLTCIEIMPNPANPTVTRPLESDDVEEVSSLLKLRLEVLKLHIDFFTDAAE